MRGTLNERNHAVKGHMTADIGAGLHLGTFSGGFRYASLQNSNNVIIDLGHYNLDYYETPESENFNDEKNFIHFHQFNGPTR